MSGRIVGMRASRADVEEMLDTITLMAQLAGRDKHFRTALAMYLIPALCDYTTEPPKVRRKMPETYAQKFAKMAVGERFEVAEAKQDRPTVSGMCRTATNRTGFKFSVHWTGKLFEVIRTK